MGKQNFTTYGYGMTESEALRNARKEDQYENGHQEGYSGTLCSAVGTIHSKCVKKPIIPKKSKVEKPTQKGARKWETVFVIQPNCFGERISHKMTARVKTTQADAIKRAKELSLEYNQQYEILIKKELVNSDSRIAVITPQKSQTGQWKFWGEARY